MFNKDYNLCYGFFLKEFSDIEIKAFKKPHTLKKVNYNKFVDDLFATPISDNKDEDNYIKKLIANINFGLLEKSQNKAWEGVFWLCLAQAFATKCICEIPCLSNKWV